MGITHQEENAPELPLGTRPVFLLPVFCTAIAGTWDQVTVTPNHFVIQRIILFAKIDTTCSDYDLKKTVGKLTFVNCDKHFLPCRLLWVCDLRVSRSQLALRAPTHQFTLLLCVCIWIPIVISHCERQLMHLQCGNFLTCLQLFGWYWSVLIFSSSFLKRI